MFLLTKKGQILSFIKLFSRARRRIAINIHHFYPPDDISRLFDHHKYCNWCHRVCCKKVIILLPKTFKRTTLNYCSDVALSIVFESHNVFYIE